MCFSRCSRIRCFHYCDCVALFAFYMFVVVICSCVHSCPRDIAPYPTGSSCMNMPWVKCTLHGFHVTRYPTTAATHSIVRLSSELPVRQDVISWETMSVKKRPTRVHGYIMWCQEKRGNRASPYFSFFLFFFIVTQILPSCVSSSASYQFSLGISSLTCS